jgi:release factor glutamine methyltransferase
VVSEATIEFAGFELATSPLVMAPRSTSGALVKHAVAELGTEPGVAVDVGTGSGAIAIAIARNAPRAIVWATDVSAPAVALAEANVQRAGVAERVHVRRGNLLDPVPGPVDVIVANLPYLPLDQRHRHPDLWAEPERAVFYLGDGLGLVRRLVATAATHLTPTGLLALQVRGHVIAATRHELTALAHQLEPAALDAA